MALQSSGAISMFDISNEFGGYAYPPVEIDDYMAADPVNQPSYGNAVGTLVDFADFYGTSIKTTRLAVQPNNDSYARYGYARTNGYFFYVSESGQSGTAFGTATRTSALASSSRSLACIVMNDTLYDHLTIGFSGGSSSTNGGWTTATFYDHQSSAPYRADLSTGITINRTDAITFGALPGTSPTVYAYRFGYAGGANTPATTNAYNVSQRIKNNATVTPYYVYVEFT
jgi:hypothetical protein